MSKEITQYKNVSTQVFHLFFTHKLAHADKSLPMLFWQLADAKFLRAKISY
jgi:hypothetical protein